MPTASPVVLLLAATLLSGAAALFYETLWTRSFALILGSTVQAASATFAAFLVGLALGARVAGRLGSRLRPLETYLALEVGIGITAGGTGLLLHRHGNFLTTFLGAPDATWRVPQAFFLALTMVLLPTLLMGATFPVILTLARARGASTQVISRVYALNTAGGALGTLACGFFALRLWGVSASYAVAIALNLASAATVLLLRRGTAPHQAALPATAEAPDALHLEAVPPEWLLAATAVLSGGAILGLEVVWTRLSSIVLGNRTFAFTTLLGWVLLLLAAGSALAGRLIRRRGRDVSRLLGQILVAAPIVIVGSVLLPNQWIQHRDAIDGFFAESPGLLVMVRVLGVGAMMAPAFVLLGTLFPLALISSRETESSVGRAAGRFYLWNTLGSVIGALGVGFVGIPRLGTFGSTSLLAGGCAVLAIIVHHQQWRRSRQRAPLVGMAASLALILLVPWVLPERLVWKRPEESVVLSREDAFGVFQLLRLPNGRLRATNSGTSLVYHLGAPITSYVQQMQGHLGVLARPDARTALVLGIGYGISTGALAAHPSLSRIDAVEIVPGMVDAAEHFEPYSLGYHRDLRVHVIVDDGRHFLATSKDRYDIISCNVSDPHTPGGSSLFSRDFFEMVKEHLTPGGVLVQHCGSEKQIILSTLNSSFPYLRLFRAYKGGYNVVASMVPLSPSEAAVRELGSAPTAKSVFQDLAILMKRPIEPWALWAKGQTLSEDSDLADLLDPANIATDDRPLLEFSTAGTARSMFSTSD